MNKPSSTANPQLGVTLLEVTISSALLTALAGVVMTSMLTTVDTVNTTTALSGAQLTAEHVARLIKTELRGATILPPPGSGVAPVAVTVPALNAPLGPGTSVSYTKLSNAGIFDPSNPFNPPPFQATARIIRFEVDGAEVLGNGVDDDGDFLIDEGRIALYSDPGNATDLIAVFGRNIQSFQVEVTPGGGAASLPLARAAIGVQRINYGVVHGTVDILDLKAGNGPRITHTATATISLLN